LESGGRIGWLGRITTFNIVRVGFGPSVGSKLDRKESGLPVEAHRSGILTASIVTIIGAGAGLDEISLPVFLACALS